MKPFLLWSCAAIAGVALSSICFSRAPADDKRPAPPAVRHADARQAAELVVTNAVIVLDVRTPREFAAGHIAGATNLNYLGGDFSDRLAQLDPSKTYLLHCAVGGRSTNALPKMARLGFTNLIHLDGGFKAWQAAGNPVVRP
jgi:rhodanese-related sulfurtransferase